MTILYILVAVLAVLAVCVALQPAAFSVSRAAKMAAPPDVIFEQVNDLHKWQEWSPWAKLDPNAKITYAGPVAGVGAAFAWSGDRKVGEGRMTITESRPHELIQFRLEMEKPMKATNIAEFTFKPEGSETLVTWTMSGTKNFACKAMGLVINCDKMCGGSFEKGLAQIKSIAEASPRTIHA